MKLASALSAISALAVVALALPFLACSTAGDRGTGATNDFTNGDSGPACKLASPNDVFCPTVFNPVCGCDGKTYGNSCEAARAVTGSSPGACVDAGPGDGGATSDASDGASNDATDATDGGACKLATPKNTFCPAVFNPVCGCDSTTYGNSCEAARFVTGSTPGACPQNSDAGACTLATPKNTFCPAVVDPVCGCDGKTYSNACAAMRVVTSSVPGACN